MMCTAPPKRLKNKPINTDLNYFTFWKPSQGPLMVPGPHFGSQCWRLTTATITELIMQPHRETRFLFSLFIYLFILSEAWITRLGSAARIVPVTHPKWGNERRSRAGAAARCSSDALTSPNLWQHFLEWRLLWEINRGAELRGIQATPGGRRTAQTTTTTPTLTHLYEHAVAAAFGRYHPIRQKKWRLRLRKDEVEISSDSQQSRAEQSRAADSTELSRCCS